MKREDIERALDMIDDDLLEEYAERPAQTSAKKRIRLKVAVAAALAAIVLLVPLSAFMLNRSRPNLPDNNTLVSSEGIFEGSSGADETEPPDTEFSGIITPPVEEKKLTVNSLTASKPLNDGVVENNTSFELEIKNASLELVKESFVITPAVDYTIKQLDEERYLFVPEAELVDNTVYKISAVEDGTVVDSWAFQTPDVLSVTGSYPANGSSNVSIGTAVEISFSYTSVTDISDFVTFEPFVSGSWKQLGKTWRFTPDKPFTLNTDYTVTVAAGISAEGQTITEDYIFTFGTYEGVPIDDVKLNGQYLSLDKISTYRPGEPVTMMFSSRSDKDAVTRAAHEARVTRYADSAAFISAVNGEASTGYALGSYSLTLGVCAKNTYGELVYLMDMDAALPIGYYRIEIHTESGKKIGEWFAQVSEVSVYAAQSSYDLFVWTADENGVIANAEVNLGGEVYTTDENGIIILDLKKLGDFENEYLHIADPESRLPLVVRLDSIDTAYPNGYIYTDKITYKADDTVNIWGYVPPVSVPETSEGKYEIVLGGAVRIPVTPDENGTFSTSYTLSDFESTSYIVTAELDGHSLAYTYFEVADYVNDYYSYEIIVPTNCVRIGDVLPVEVKVTHISGVPAINKSVCLTTGGLESSFATTDEYGIARFDAVIEKSFRHGYYAVERIRLAVSSAEAHDGNADYKCTENLFLICSDKHITAEQADEGIRYTVREVVIPEDGFVESEEELYGDAVDSELIVNIDYVTVTRTVTGYDFDELLKENIPLWETDTKQAFYERYTVSAEDGAYLFNKELTKDADTDTVRYYYSVKVTIKDADGVREHRTMSYMAEPVDYNNGLYSSFIGFVDHESINLSLAYRTYRYRFLNENRTYNGFAVGDSIDISFEEYDVGKTDGGILMAVIMQNGIKQSLMLDESVTESIPFTEDMMPGVLIEGVYYKDGVFHRVEGFRAELDANSYDLEAEISYDKEEYAPGDEMTVTVKLYDKEGEPAKGASVNLSVVDKSAGDLHGFGRLGNELGRCTYSSYTYSSYRDYELYGFFDGGWGGGGGTRCDFADAPLFVDGTTDENGEASFTFTLPDSVTEFNVTLHGASGDISTVAHRSSFRVSLDYFISYKDSLEIKSSDDAVISAAVIGEVGLQTKISFTVKELDKTVVNECETNNTVHANFGKLEEGIYTVLIEAESENHRDAVEYTVEVIDTALSFANDTEIDVYSDEAITPESNPVTFKIHADAYDRYMRYFSFLTSRAEVSREDVTPLITASKAERFALCGTPYSDNTYSRNGVAEGEIFIKATSNHEEDPVLTALLIYYLPKYMSEYTAQMDEYLCGELLCKLEGVNDAAEKLMVAAAYGRPVLSELHNMVAKAEKNDTYSRLILTLGLIFSGDYDTARELYLTIGDDSGDEGFEALRAIAAAYVDREFVGDMIDVLLTESPDMMYLRFAVYAYIKNRCDLSADELSMTLYYGDTSETVTLKGLEEKKITIITDAAERIYFEPHRYGLRVLVHYVEGREYLENGDKNIPVYLEGDIKENATVYLCIDLTAFDSDYGKLAVVLPDALAFTADRELPEGYSVSNNIVTNRLTVGKYVKAGEIKDYTGTLRIPLTVKHKGDFILEEAVFTATDGRIGYSDKIEHNEIYKW